MLWLMCNDSFWTAATWPLQQTTCTKHVSLENAKLSHEMLTCGCSSCAAQLLDRSHVAHQYYDERGLLHLERGSLLQPRRMYQMLRQVAGMPRVQVRAAS